MIVAGVHVTSYQRSILAKELHLKHMLFCNKQAQIQYNYKCRVRLEINEHVRQLRKIKIDHSCLSVVKESAHGLKCSFISWIKSENRRKGKVGQKPPDSFRIKTFTRY